VILDNNETKRLVTTLAESVGIDAACDSFDVPKSTYYYWISSNEKRRNKITRTPDFAYSDNEKQKVLSLLNSDEYVDRTPYEVYYSELDKGNYHCSIRTMYRILDDNKQVRERRNIKSKTNYKKPELIATKPNEVWSWDITKLKGPAKWTYFYLYVIIDVFSRFVVGWMLEYRESSSLNIFHLLRYKASRTASFLL